MNSNYQGSFTEEICQPPDDFKFPFPPYPIQVDFMKALFMALEEKKLGIFESPTGTCLHRRGIPSVAILDGKSLSLLCGSLTWLENRDEARLQHLEMIISSVDLEKEEINVKGAENWILAQHQLRQKKEIVNEAKRELQFQQALRDRRKKYLSHNSSLKADVMKWKQHDKRTTKSQDSKNKTQSSVEDELDDLLLNDDFAPEAYSDLELSEEENDEEPEFHQSRIIFASRTHSQLSQFAKELRRTEFASKVTSCSLGSRQNLCINPEVIKLKNLSLMNERCLEIQKGSKGKKTSETKKMKGCGACAYFNQVGIEELKTEILSQPMDIEDLVSTAKQLKACPYYASRKASKEAQLVMLPYNTILHKSTREGVGLEIKNSVILLDEAHNIIDSISNMHSTSVTLGQLKDCSTGMQCYMKRYMNRFNPKHLLKLKQVCFIIKSLQKFLESPENQQYGPVANAQAVFTIQEFKVEVGIDNLDIYELQKFIKNSKLIFKLKGYLVQRQKIEEKATEVQSKAPLSSAKQISQSKRKESNPHQSRSKVPNLKASVLENVDPVSTSTHSKPQSNQFVLSFAEFLKSLLTLDSGGRIIRDEKTLKFLLLNTTDHFSDLLTFARSVILAGGTMKPYAEVEDQLFHSARNRIVHFSCGHVIPDENLICIGLNRGPSSRLLDFTYQSRKTPETMTELARTITNVSKIVPGGMVCFLPSYEYESSLHEYLEKNGYLQTIALKKKIFREPKDSSCETVLSEYSRQIKNSSSGALLFAVIGGKLSEGINFSDDLGRCVLVVGLPFPNIKSVEIKEKVQFVSNMFGKEKGSQLLATMCSKAVNQSIGRAIRHSQDYAAIILVDNRYSRPDQQSLLPNWIQKRFQVCENFGQAIGNVSQFFARKKPTQ